MTSIHRHDEFQEIRHLTLIDVLLQSLRHQRQPGALQLREVDAQNCVLLGVGANQGQARRRIYESSLFERDGGDGRVNAISLRRCGGGRLPFSEGVSKAN